MNDELNSKSISITVAVYKKTEYWIAYSPALKTFGYSKENEESALTDLDRAIETFFHVQNTLGTLPIALKNLGWTRVEQKIEQPKYFNYPGTNSWFGNAASKKQRQISMPA